MTAPQLGTLTWVPATDRPDLLGEPVAAALAGLSGPAWVAGIDADLADTAAFSEALAAQGNAPAVPVTPSELEARLARESRAFEEVANSIDLGNK